MKNKRRNIILNVVFFTAIGILAFLGVSSFIDQATGYNFPLFGMRNSVIVSPSMSYANEANDYLNTAEYSIGRIQTYDVVTTRLYKSYDEVKLYDVVTYFDGKALVCHRVIDKYIDDETHHKCLITRGDANNMSDFQPVTWSQVRGKVISVSKGTGKVVLFFQSPYFLIAICGSLFFVFLGLFIFERKKKQPELAEQENKEAISENEPIQEQPVDEKPSGEKIDEKE